MGQTVVIQTGGKRVETPEILPVHYGDDPIGIVDDMRCVKDEHGLWAVRGKYQTTSSTHVQGSHNVTGSLTAVITGGALSRINLVGERAEPPEDKTEYEEQHYNED